MAWIFNRISSTPICSSSISAGWPGRSQGETLNVELRTDTSIPGSTDPLGETLHLLRLTGTLYCRSELTAPWGIEMPPFEGCMMFHVVTGGQGWLEVEGEEPRLRTRSQC
jgi:hypothetical protein